MGRCIKTGALLLLIVLGVPSVAWADDEGVSEGEAVASEATLMGVCDEAAAAVSAHASDCGAMAGALEALLGANEGVIRGTLRPGFRGRYPRAVRHCEGLATDAERVAPALQCLVLEPRMQALLERAQRVARGR